MFKISKKGLLVGILAVPLILLTGLMLMHEPQKPVTVVGEAATWEIERPTELWGVRGK
jgi:hypothetical protein